MPHGLAVVLQLYAEAEKRQKMAKRKDYYKILSVDQSASSRDIKSVSVNCTCRGVCLRVWLSWQPRNVAAAPATPTTVVAHLGAGGWEIRIFWFACSGTSAARLL